MSERIILNVPEDISARARQIAKTTDQPVEQVLIAHLTSLTLPPLPADEQAELDALRFLSDDALRTIAREQMPDDVQRRAHALMDKNNHGDLSESEADELDGLVTRADGLMLRKAEAGAILKQRGFSMSQDDFKPAHD